VALTPVEIRHLHFARRLFGYRRTAVDDKLDEIADSFEDVWRDRADLADKVEHLEGELVRYRELETLLHTTLVSAERGAAELKEQAQREADLVLGEAHAEARAVTRRAQAEYERLAADARRLKSLLRSALATLDEEVAGEEAPAKDDWEKGDGDDTGQWGAAA
jgi:cell division initiation protein